MEENNPSARPPAAGMSSRSSLRDDSGSPSRPGGGRGRATERTPPRGGGRGSGPRRAARRGARPAAQPPRAAPPATSPDNSRSLLRGGGLKGGRPPWGQHRSRSLLEG